MLFQFAVFLSVCSLILASDSTDVIVASHIYDDIELEQIKGNLSLLQDTTKDLIQKIDLQDQSLIEVKTLLHEMNNNMKNLNCQQMNDLISTKLDKLNQQFVLKQQESKDNFKNLTAQLSFRNCSEALQKNNGTRGVYQIKMPNLEQSPFEAYCMRNNINHITVEPNTDWLLILRRLNGEVDFNRNWTDNQNGFGNINGEFFIGLNKLHALTKSRPHELWILLANFANEFAWAKYSNFAIGNEAEAYELKSLGEYTGNACKDLALHLNQKWSTKDVDNDKSSKFHCAVVYKGAWWYKTCLEYYSNGYTYNIHMDGQSIIPSSWYSPSHHQTRYVHMAIRPIY